MLVQMERQIDREIAADNKANGVAFGTQTDTTQLTTIGTENEEFDSDSEEEEDDSGPMLMYGPQPQIVTNDLKSLDEMVSSTFTCLAAVSSLIPGDRAGDHKSGDRKTILWLRLMLPNEEIDFTKNLFLIEIVHCSRMSSTLRGWTNGWYKHRNEKFVLIRARRREITKRWIKDVKQEQLFPKKKHEMNAHVEH